MEDLEVGCVQRGFRRTAKHVDGPRQQLLLPFRDLCGMHTKLCGQIRQRLLAFDRSERHLCLEGCPMIAPRSLHRLAPWFAPLGVGLSKATTYHTVRISAPPLSHGGTGYWHVREINCKAIGGGG